MLLGAVIIMDAFNIKEAIAGNYSGSGRGLYPTIQPFEYDEIVKFTLSPKGFLHYVQATFSVIDRSPMHSECGYMRIFPDLKVEFLVSQPTGISEIAQGVAVVKESGSIELELDSTISYTSSAKRVTRSIRRFCFDTWGMRYEMDMATEDVDLTLHLSAVLSRGGKET